MTPTYRTIKPGTLRVLPGRQATTVLYALAHPLRTIQAENDRFEAQGWIDRARKRMLLRVICEHGVVVTVVTVMSTSKLEKYGVIP